MKLATLLFQRWPRIQSPMPSSRRRGRSRYQWVVVRFSGRLPQTVQAGSSNLSGSIQVPQLGHSSPRAASCPHT